MSPQRGCAVRVKIIHSKSVTVFSLLALLLASNGCMTWSAIQDAQGHATKAVWKTSDSKSDDKSHPGYYFLLPLTIPADIAIAPVSFWYLAMWTDGFRQF